MSGVVDHPSVAVALNFQSIVTKTKSFVLLRMSSSIIIDIHFVLMEECPPLPTQNASHVSGMHMTAGQILITRRLYIFGSMSDILSKKHEIMVTVCQIIDSLREMFGQQSIQIK
ncbi:gag/pol protein [Cucumis melo var. makuwa]|uniref:Gag/pol protein n=1 Tax=Cucumis melo var. makuwa TaxID=1194695 RepID=A0A5A7VJL2_CUCMM|nr:gag/pol protein [Cucumis melo var. makuwa]TYJ97210.1 gag/pol protein [Cucumis melo var. makuwa]